MMGQTVNDQQAVLLAMHATLVQGGFSTPEIEKARAEKDLANGGTIDWEKIAHEIATHAAQTEEAEAALEEGLLPMPADLVPLRDEKLTLDEQIDSLQARKRDIQDIFGARLETDGAVGYVLNGKVHARRSHCTRTDVDKPKLKESFRSVYEQVLKVIEYTTVRIN